MKSAYLIIAHDNFQVLQLLLDALDTKEVDFYLHVDKKVISIPNLSVNESCLYILEERIDVRWGDISQIETEFLLWKTAYMKGPYQYYHLISGTHFPLKPVGTITSYFNKSENKNLFVPMYTDEYEIDLKIRRLNICTKSYKHHNHLFQRASQFCWLVFHKVQKAFKFKRYKEKCFYKASNWCSLTHEAVAYLISISNDILNKYRYTFCGDEFFAITELCQSDLSNTVEFREDYLEVDFSYANPKAYSMADFHQLVNSNRIFARKFSDSQINIVFELYKKNVNGL